MILLIKRGLLRSFSILMIKTYKTAIIKTLLLVLNPGSNNTLLEKKDKQKTYHVPPMKDGAPVLENEVDTENVAKIK